MTNHLRRALISVSNKEGVIELARELVSLGVDILSTGGTSQVLRQAGLSVQDVSSLTGFPEIMDGRVKTLHPKIFGGLLSLRGNESHDRDMATHGIVPIDLVVVNLYPFESVCTDRGLPEEERLEYIDIGGSTLIRAASKNFQSVACLVDPADYRATLDEWKSTGNLSVLARRKLAAKAFAHTAHYDAVIADTFRSTLETPAFPTEFAPALRKRADLRYGENPHQKAALYVESGRSPWGVAGAKVLQGKQVSYNNYLDCDAAWRLVTSFSLPAAVILKHNNPCGVALHERLAEAFRLAQGADPLSSFGGIVGFNRPVDGETAKELSTLFLECVVAPAYTPEARAVLGKKINLRLLEQPLMTGDGGEWDLRKISGGYLVQDQDHFRSVETRVVSKRVPTLEEIESLLFAWNVAKQVKSNAIVLARGPVTVGIGAGQMSRVDALNVAYMKLTQKEGAGPSGPLVLASDGFFPFRDTLDAAARMGVTAVIQPGGSVRDEESVTAADEHGLAMVVTGVRHFRH